MASLLTFCFCVALYPAPVDDPERPPLQIAFTRFCGPAHGGDDAFEPRTETFHIYFHEGDPVQRISQASEFEVLHVSARLPKRLAFRLTGLPKHPAQPLEMHVGDESYTLDPKRHDKNLFKVERRGGATRIEFTAKGMALLKPGTRFSFVEMVW